MPNADKQIKEYVNRDSTGTEFQDPAPRLIVAVRWVGRQKRFDYPDVASMYLLALVEAVCFHYLALVLALALALAPTSAALVAAGAVNLV